MYTRWCDSQTHKSDAAAQKEASDLQSLYMNLQMIEKIWNICWFAL